MGVRLILAWWFCICLSVCVAARQGVGAEPGNAPESAAVSQDKKLLIDYHQSAEARAEAAARLRKAGASVLPDLLGAIRREPDPKTRMAIMGAATAAVMHAKCAFPTELIEPLFDGDAAVRALAASNLGGAGHEPPEAVALLLKALHHKDFIVRSSAAAAIARSGADPKSVLAELTKALQDPYISVRENAACSIWSMTKRADLVIPIQAAIVGSTGPLKDREEEMTRNLCELGLLMAIKEKFREKPIEVCAELVRGLRSPSEDIRTGSAMLFTAFLKSKDRDLDARRSDVRKELRRLTADPDARVRLLVFGILTSAEDVRPAPKCEPPQSRP
jgi:HEAT repeat protein